MIEISIFEANISKQGKNDFLGDIFVNIGSRGVTPSIKFFQTCSHCLLSMFYMKKLSSAGLMFSMTIS